MASRIFFIAFLRSIDTITRPCYEYRRAASSVSFKRETSRILFKWPAPLRRLFRPRRPWPPRMIQPPRPLPPECTCPEDRPSFSDSSPRWKQSVLSQRAQCGRGLKSTAAIYLVGRCQRRLEMSELIGACAREIESQSQDCTLMCSVIAMSRADRCALLSNTAAMPNIDIRYVLLPLWQCPRDRTLGLKMWS